MQRQRWYSLAVRSLSANSARFRARAGPRRASSPHRGRCRAPQRRSGPGPRVPVVHPKWLERVLPATPPLVSESPAPYGPIIAHWRPKARLLRRSSGQSEKGGFQVSNLRPRTPGISLPIRGNSFGLGMMGGVGTAALRGPSSLTTSFRALSAAPEPHRTSSCSAGNAICGSVRGPRHLGAIHCCLKNSLTEMEETDDFRSWICRYRTYYDRCNESRCDSCFSCTPASESRLGR
jgi:hypothetical protein